MIDYQLIISGRLEGFLNENFTRLHFEDERIFLINTFRNIRSAKVTVHTWSFELTDLKDQLRTDDVKPACYCIILTIGAGG